MESKNIDYKFVLPLVDYENQRHNFVLLLYQCETQEQQIKLMEEIKRLDAKINHLIKLIAL